MKGKPQPEPSYCMTEEAISRLQSCERKSLTAEFRHLFRKEKGYRGDPEGEWSRIVSGQPVREIYARAFTEFARERLDWEVDQDAIFRVVFSPTEKGIWRSQQAVIDTLVAKFQSGSEMYVGNLVEDTLTATRMIMHTLGHKTAEKGDDLSRGACIQRGETKCPRNAAQYAQWLLSLAKGEFSRILMFSVHKHQRVGAVVVLPLSEAAYRKTVAGEMGSFDYTPADLSLPAYALFIHAMSDAEDFPNLKVSAKTQAQARTMLYQAAYFTWRLKPYRPAVVSLATNDFYRDLMVSQGMRDSGAVDPASGFRIMVIRHPSETRDRRVSSKLQYHLLITVSRIYQIVNSRAWRKELKLLGKLP